MTYWISPGSGLCRQERPWVTADGIRDNTDPDYSTEATDVLASEITDATFEYFDGSTWQSSWNPDGSTMSDDGVTPIGPPRAVRVTLSFSFPSSRPNGTAYETTLVKVIPVRTAPGSLTPTMITPSTDTGSDASGSSASTPAASGSNGSTGASGGAGASSGAFRRRRGHGRCFGGPQGEHAGACRAQGEHAGSAGRLQRQEQHARARRAVHRRREGRRPMIRRSQPTRPGYVLVAVLIVSVVLSLAAYQFTELMTAEYRAAARSCDAVQAREAAVSGVHYAAGMLADPTTYATDLAGNPFIDGAFQPQIVRQGVGPRTQANCQLIAVAPDGNGGYVARYGAVTDEAGKLNINALILADPSGEMLAAALTALQQALQASQKPCGSLLSANAIDCIVDWVDGDDDPRANGAESSSYQGKGFKAKNGPLNSLDELLFVQGVTPQLLYGTDRNRNGVDDEGSGANSIAASPITSRSMAAN